MKYKFVVGGGTFDHLHAGHKALLSAMLTSGERVLLGITSDTYLQQTKKSPTGLQTYSQRESGVLKFLQDEKATGRVTIRRIDSALLPKEWERLPIEAIVVTDHTLSGAKLINNDRRNKGLKPLEVVVSPFVTDSQGQKISSTRIRAGEINAKGTTYWPQEMINKDLVLPETERHWFKSPFGHLIEDSALNKENLPRLVTIGDATTEKCNNLGLKQQLSVIDFVIQRKKTHRQLQDLGFEGNEVIINASNPHGHITRSLNAAIIRALELINENRRIVLVVDGEEDLAVIPLVLALPLGYSVLYGLPNEGVVELKVTTEAKDKALNLLHKFTEV